MIKHKNVIPLKEDTNMTNLGLTRQEFITLQEETTLTAMNLYSYLKTSLAYPVKPDYYTPKNISKNLGLAQNTVQKALTILKKKKLLYIVHSKDTSGIPLVYIVLGYELCVLFDFGLRVTVSTKALNKAKKDYPQIFDKNTPNNVREKLIEKINEQLREDANT